MSPGQYGVREADHCFPRMSGDEPYADIVAMLLDVFSPHERG